jgi:hypothetical protein
MRPLLYPLSRVAYVLVAILGLMMTAISYLGPSPPIDEAHLLWWGWVVGFGAALPIGATASFATDRMWPHYIVAAGALLLVIWQCRGAVAILDVRPPFHSSPWTVLIVVTVVALELVGLLAALARAGGLLK